MTESIEMRYFFLHREVSLSLIEMAFLYARGERPTFAEMVDWVARRRGTEEELNERTALVLAHLTNSASEHGIYDEFADADPVAVVFALGAAATRAANFSADQAQQHAINVETPA